MGISVALCTNTIQYISLFDGGGRAEYKSNFPFHFPARLFLSHSHQSLFKGPFYKTDSSPKWTCRVGPALSSFLCQTLFKANTMGGHYCIDGELETLLLAVLVFSPKTVGALGVPQRVDQLSWRFLI